MHGKREVRANMGRRCPCLPLMLPQRRYWKYLYLAYCIALTYMLVLGERRFRFVCRQRMFVVELDTRRITDRRPVTDAALESMTVGQPSMEWDGVASCPACMPIRARLLRLQTSQARTSASSSVGGRYSYPPAMSRDCDVGAFGKGTGRLKIQVWIWGYTASRWCTEKN